MQDAEERERRERLEWVLEFILSHPMMHWFPPGEVMGQVNYEFRNGERADIVFELPDYRWLVAAVGSPGFLAPKLDAVRALRHKLLLCDEKMGVHEHERVDCALIFNEPLALLLSFCERHGIQHMGFPFDLWA